MLQYTFFFFIASYISKTAFEAKMFYTATCFHTYFKFPKHHKNEFSKKHSFLKLIHVWSNYHFLLNPKMSCVFHFTFLVHKSYRNSFKEIYLKLVRGSYNSEELKMSFFLFTWFKRNSRNVVFFVGSVHEWTPFMMSSLHKLVNLHILLAAITEKAAL